MTPSRQGARRVEMALPTILELIGAVRDGDAQAVARAVNLLDMPAAVVLLAAMVDDTRTPTDLLAWTEDLPSARQARARRRLTYRGRQLVPCGSHAAFNRHRSHRETPCEPCAAAEIAYQAARQIRRRATHNPPKEPHDHPRRTTGLRGVPGPQGAGRPANGSGR